MALWIETADVIFVDWQDVIWSPVGEVSNILFEITRSQLIYKQTEEIGIRL